jgi:hypothetical protein
MPTPLYLQPLWTILYGSIRRPRRSNSGLVSVREDIGVSIETYDQINLTILFLTKHLNSYIKISSVSCGNDLDDVQVYIYDVIIECLRVQHLMKTGDIQGVIVKNV